MCSLFISFSCYYVLYNIKRFNANMNFKTFVSKLWWTLSAFNTINNLPDAVIYIDSEGNIKHFNKKAREVFGLRNYNCESEDSNININDLIKDGTTVLKASLAAARPALATATIPGREFYVEINASKKGKGLCVSIRDLTKLTNEIFNDEKTIKFNNEKNAMLVKLEGDIKSPITSISGFSQGLLDGLGGVLTEKQAKYVKIINSNSEELYHFMDKLLEFSYAESSLYQPDMHNFDIVEVFKTINSDFQKVIEEKKLAFDLNYDNIEKRNVYTDLTAIKKIYRNILEVALPMTETGYVLIKLSHPDEITCMKYKLEIPANKQKPYLHISIRDTGAGISEDDMKYICEPYAQLEKGKKNFLRALKLGSASILTKRANGIINITSEIMKGTKYDIILPIEKD